ncbi:unnamed protein product [Calypogeia fissa]
METKDSGVQLLQVAHSPYCQTVRIALAEKGVPFTVIEEDLLNKSKLLLESNPMHRKVPVLIHNGRPIAESTIIVQYLDDTWPVAFGGPDRHSFLPDTAYRRAQARFWVDFLHAKVFKTTDQMLKAKDDEIDRAAFNESMLSLNSAIIQCAGDERPFFFGKRLGYVDLVLAPFISWFSSLDKFVNLRIPPRTEAPRLHEWIESLSEHPTIKAVLFDNAFVEQKMAGVRAVYRRIAEGRKAQG